MQDAYGTQRTLERSVLLATEILDGCDQAGVSIIHLGRGIDTPAATGDMVRQADQLQYTYQEGPCLDAIWHEETVSSHDLANDPRWPQWGPKVVADYHVAAMLSFQLYTTSHSLGALNLYSDTVDGFDEEDVTAGTFLAAHIAVALAESQNADNLQIAGLSRTLIGQAQGILMERYGLSSEDAFATLRRVSQQSNTKLHHIATELISTRQTPGQDQDHPLG